MKQFILRRVMQCTESVVVEAESWDEAKAILADPDTEFEPVGDDHPYDETIEYIGEV